MFQCKDLYTLSSLSKLKLIAGNNGLHKGIRWVYKAESLSLSQWVHGGELLIISRPTAYGEYAPYCFVDTEKEFETLVKSLR